MGIVPSQHFHDGFIIYNIKGCATLKWSTKNNSQKHEVAKVQNIEMLVSWLKFLLEVCAVAIPLNFFAIIVHFLSRLRFPTEVIFFLQKRNTIFVLPRPTSFSSLESRWALGLLGWKRLWMELICRKLDDLHLFEIPGMVCCYIQVGSPPSQRDYTASTDLHIYTFCVWLARFGN